MIAVAAALLIALAVGAAAAFVWVEFSERIAALTRQHQSIEQQLSGLSQRLGGIDGRFAPLMQRDEDLAAELAQLRQVALPAQQLTERLAGLETRIARVDQTVQQLAPGLLRAGEVLDRVNRLEALALRAATFDQRLETLEKGTGPARDALVRAASTVLAIGQLVGAARGGGGFQPELLTLKITAGADADLQAAVAAIEPYALSGVPTQVEIVDAFPAVAVAVVRAERGASGDDWFDRVRRRLSGLVVIRRTGADAIVAGGTEGLLAEAEQALSAGDLRAAVEAVARIEPPGAAAAAEWLAAARARLAVDQGLLRLQDRAILRLSELRG